MTGSKVLFVETLLQYVGKPELISIPETRIVAKLWELLFIVFLLSSVSKGGDQAGKFAYCVLGQGVSVDPSTYDKLNRLVAEFIDRKVLCSVLA